MNEIQRPVLRYFGGKFILAPWIISHFPAHRVYVEPFGGAASVLMRKPRSYAEVYNDLDGEIVELFQVLRNKVTANLLRKSLEITPFARDEFNLAYEPGKTPVERARRLIIRAFMGFGSDGHNVEAGKTGFRANSNRSGTTPAHDWANFPKCLPQFTERLVGVVIENRDAAEIIAQQDSSETLFYVDPPYVHDTRGTKHNYRFELTNDDHAKLLDRLRKVQGMVVLSGYDTNLYNALGWHKATKATKADGARDRIECLWLNPAAEAAQPQRSLFGSDALLREEEEE